MSDSGQKAAAKAKAAADALGEGAHKALESLEENAKVIGDGAHKALDDLEKGADDALQSLEKGASKGAKSLNAGAHKALASLERTVAKADAALAVPKDADLAPLLSATDLPELAPEGALKSLGVRLDREADLYRNVALRELSRVSWIDRVTLISVLVAFVGEAGVAACAAFSGLIGSNDGRGSLFALAATILAVAPAGVAAVVAGARKMHRDLATDALTRSRTIEERLFQLGVVMEWRGTEPALFQDALARLEATRSGRSRDDGDGPA